MTHKLENCRIMFWPQRLDDTVASYRIRCAQVMRGLKKDGVETEIYSDTFRRYFEFIPRIRPPHIIVLSKRTKISSLERVLRLKARYGTKLVLDLSDNIFFAGQNDGNKTRIKRARLPHLVNGFDAIVTPSTYLRDILAKHLRADMAFHVIPDAVEEEPSDRGTKEASQKLAKLNEQLTSANIPEGRRLVWYGVSGTQAAKNGMYDVQAYCAALKAHNDQRPLSLTIISDNEQRFKDLFAETGFQCFYLPWNLHTFNPALRFHDIAVLPIRTNEYTLAKSANRLTSAFANGLAACASLIPSYEPFSDAAVFDDWDEGLGTLMADPNERAVRIAKAATVISTSYTLAAVCDQWSALFKHLHEKH
ncbi:hypothetical protein [Rhizobium sp. Rhizsp82]|uniref:hypothetical protein n=1 Tax=Rhizobium sp. Rhizsp82 TaxID=3243057 RepID=UPI0039B40C15